MSHLLKHHYGGWRPQKPDHRDHVFATQISIAATPHGLALPGLSLIPQLNQGQQGSCTGHGPSGLVMFDQHKQGLPIVVPSPAMIYYNARIPEGTTDQDAGAEVRDAVKGIVKYGVCPNSEFPYNDQVYNLKPSAQCYADATKQEALVYESVRYPHINQALAAGYPIVFGFTVYESFESEEVAKTGIVPIPGPGEQVLGGHCTFLWGYNDLTSNFTQPDGRIIPPRSKASRNSWVNEDGTPWGDHGDFYLPQAYFDRGLCSDFWVIRRIGAR